MAKLRLRLLLCSYSSVEFDSMRLSQKVTLSGGRRT